MLSDRIAAIVPQKVGADLAALIGCLRHVFISRAPRASKRDNEILRDMLECVQLCAREMSTTKLRLLKAHWLVA